MMKKVQIFISLIFVVILVSTTSAAPYRAEPIAVSGKVMPQLDDFLVMSGDLQGVIFIEEDDFNKDDDEVEYIFAGTLVVGKKQYSGTAEIEFFISDFTGWTMWKFEGEDGDLEDFSGYGINFNHFRYQGNLYYTPDDD